MPVTKDNLRDTMTYHSLDALPQASYARIEAAAITFTEVLLEVLPPCGPPCGDQQAAIRHIFEAKATANRGVAVHAIVSLWRRLKLRWAVRGAPNNNAITTGLLPVTEQHAAETTAQQFKRAHGYSAATAPLPWSEDISAHNTAISAEYNAEVERRKAAYMAEDAADRIAQIRRTHLHLLSNEDILYLLAEVDRLSAGIAQLIARWRRHDRARSEAVWQFTDDQLVVFGVCAEQLAAVLPSPAVEPTEPNP